MKNQKGFTLLELMIVMAVIGILAAIAIPKFKEMLAKHRAEANGEKYVPPVRSERQVQYNTYTLSNGQVVECETHYDSSCGLTLYNCKDGREYKCQTNVSYKKN